MPNEAQSLASGENSPFLLRRSVSLKNASIWPADQGSSHRAAARDAPCRPLSGSRLPEQRRTHPRCGGCASAGRLSSGSHAASRTDRPVNQRSAPCSWSCSTRWHGALPSAPLRCAPVRVAVEGRPPPETDCGGAIPGPDGGCGGVGSAASASGSAATAAARKERRFTISIWDRSSKVVLCWGRSPSERSNMSGAEHARPSPRSRRRTKVTTRRQSGGVLTPSILRQWK